MCVHNDSEYLPAALDSIFAQTYRDFECVVVDDGSTDATPAILRDCADARLVVHTQPHIGLTRSLNRGLAAARGAYVARQDADDLSSPIRFERQAAFLDSHTEVALVGTAVRVVDEAGRSVGEDPYPSGDAELRRALLRRHNPLPHSSIMLRREVALALSGWDERFVKAQDYEYYLRLIELYRIASLPQRLVTLRFRTGSLFSSGEAGEQLKYALLAHALAALRRAHPERVPPRSSPLPLGQFEAWYQSSAYPAQFAAGQRRREARQAFGRGQLLRAARALGRAFVLDRWYPLRRLLPAPDRAMVELAREFAGWIQSADI